MDDKAKEQLELAKDRVDRADKRIKFVLQSLKEFRDYTNKLIKSIEGFDDEGK